AGSPGEQPNLVERGREALLRQKILSVLSSLCDVLPEASHTQKLQQSPSPKSKYVVFNQAKVIHKRADVDIICRGFMREKIIRSQNRAQCPGIILAVGIRQRQAKIRGYELG
ncbi:hypothetical protein AMECASPLE_015678, partial [Ameca splendens]